MCLLKWNTLTYNFCEIRREIYDLIAIEPFFSQEWLTCNFSKFQHSTKQTGDENSEIYQLEVVILTYWIN